MRIQVWNRLAAEPLGVLQLLLHCCKRRCCGGTRNLANLKFNFNRIAELIFQLYLRRFEFVLFNRFFPDIRVKGPGKHNHCSLCWRPSRQSPGLGAVSIVQSSCLSSEFKSPGPGRRRRRRSWKLAVRPQAVGTRTWPGRGQPVWETRVPSPVDSVPPHGDLRGPPARLGGADRRQSRSRRCGSVCTDSRANE